MMTRRQLASVPSAPTLTLAPLAVASSCAPSALPPELDGERAPASERVEHLRQLAGGEQLTLAHAEQGQRLTLSSREGQALVEYDTQTGRVRICGPVSSVCLESSAADVELRSEGNLSLCARGALKLSSSAAVTLEVTGQDARTSASARLAPYGISFAARQINLAADSARFNLRRAELRGEQLRAIWSRASLTSARLELNARDVRTKLHTVLQDIEGTLSVKAGQVRQWVRGSSYTQAERSELLVRQDVRIDGKSINLG